MKLPMHSRKIPTVKFLSLFLCALILLSALPPQLVTSAHTVPLLYTNDSVFPSWQDTPPQDVNGVTYIPITMFIELEHVYYFSNPKSGSFYLQNEITKEYLSFSAENPNNAYNGKTMLNISIKVFNNAIYLPAIDTANNLGLYIEMNTDRTVVRLSDASARMSFNQLISLYTPTEKPPVEQAPDSQKPPKDDTSPEDGTTTQPDSTTSQKPPVKDPPENPNTPPSTVPDEPNPPATVPDKPNPPTTPNPPDTVPDTPSVTLPPEEPEILPCDVYLCFADPDIETLDSLLIALENQKLGATFFFSPEYILENPDCVMRISTLGYSAALNVQGEYADFDSLYGDISAANTALERITKQKTRIVAVNSLQNNLEKKGYISHSFDIQPTFAYTSKMMAENIISQFNFHPTARVLMSTDITSVSALYEIGEYILENDIINSYQIDETI